MSVFEAVMLHFTTKCAKNCPFCYQKEKQAKPFSFFLSLIPHIAPYTDRICLGGGEPLYDEKHIDFCNRFVELCKDYDVRVSITTALPKRARKIRGADISVSFDEFKFDFREFYELIKNLDGVGVNYLLIDRNPMQTFARVILLAEHHPVFLLSPKFVPFRLHPFVLTLLQHENVFCDECLYLTLKYGLRWKEPCGYAHKLISIHPDGSVRGCSFSTNIIYKLNSCGDWEKAIEACKKEEVRFHCPYLRYISRLDGI